MADSAATNPPPPVGEAAPDQDQTPPAAGKDRAAAAQRRTRLFTILGGAVALVAVGVLLYWLLIGQFSVSTDNAYVNADTADITPLISAPVTDVKVSETQTVKKGDVLVTLDDSDTRVALDQARAELGQAERKVSGYYSNNEALAGQVSARDADIARADAQIASARSDLERAQTELGRRQRLATTGAVSGDELTQAQNQFHTAQAALAEAEAGRIQALANKTAAEASRKVNEALIAGSSFQDNPEIAAARANVAMAELNESRTVLRAPFDGVIAKKQVSIGQRVAVGSDLMTVVPVESAYVDANFKEVQLRKVRVGQPVTLVADKYGDSVKFHGTVIGFAGGTGAAFAMIPAQNATGNWIKVVQRLPVRIQLRPDELRQHPLQVGLSMKAVVDVSRR
jgi:membrane fusion protein (multidrug efflux system)